MPNLKPTALHKTSLSLIILLLGLLVTPQVLANGYKDLVIVHTNDLHGHLLPVTIDGEVRGGIARVVGLVETLRDQVGDQLLWLDGGDTWHGSNVASLFKGESVVDLLNIGGLDAMVLGNHDFNYGQHELHLRTQQAEFPVLSANVATSDGAPFAPSSTILERGEHRIGVIGLTTPSTPHATHPGNVAGLNFYDPIGVAKQLAAELVDEVDLVIALTHLGLENDRLLAAAVPEIDLIVGGHSHTRLAGPMLVGDTIIVQAHEWGKYLGYLRLTLDDQGIKDYEGRLLPITDQLPGDPEVESRLRYWNTQLDARLNVVIGQTLVDLDGANERVRTCETNLGNLVADMARAAASAEIALVNAGAIRISVPSGPITVGSIFEMLPFENTVIGVELTGELLLATLENGLSHYPYPSGRFLQVSGLRLEFDPTKAPGERVTGAYITSRKEMDLEPIDPNGVYRVAVTDFMALGGDEYDMLIGTSIYFGSMEVGGILMADLMGMYLTDAGTVAPELEGRIQLKPSALPAGFVDASDVIPDLALDIRYYGENNFMGRPVFGYEAPLCILTEEAAQALAQVQARLEVFGLGLKVFDCYRPQIAVAAFGLWAQDVNDTLKKAEFYPDVDKQDLFALGYIAERSGHSRGSTIDLTLIDKTTGQEIDMGTGFDMFSPLSWPDAPSMTAQQRANRMLLQSVMMESGFVPYAQEWWHFTLANEPFPDTYFEFPVN